MLKISDIQKRKAGAVVDPIMADSEYESREAALKLSREASSYGLNLRDFLDLAVDLSEGEEKELHEKGLSGFEIVSKKMNLPMKNDLRNQISLAQASDTFATKPGSRIMFPYTIDGVLRWNDRQNDLENVEDIIASSRTINGNELIRIIAEDTPDDRKTFTVPEGARIPVRKVKTSSQAVTIYKHASGMEFTYEFERRNMIDIVQPFASRIERDLRQSKLACATSILMNGDGVNGAAIAFDAAGAGKDTMLSYDNLIELVIKSVKDNNPVDTLCGDIDAYWQYVRIFMNSTSSAFFSDQAAERGAPLLTLGKRIFGPLNFVLNSNVPAGKVLAFNRADTLEELVESGSRVQEETKAIMEQITTYVRSENAGYALIYPKTRYLMTYRKDD